MNYHHWLEALHVITVIAWMAGMLYLPRLYVYHAGVEHNSESCQMLQVMERRLLRVIINPAMILTFILGLSLMFDGKYYYHGWFHAKASLVIIMSIIHGMLVIYRKAFASGKNKHSALFYKIINETITALMIAIVILVIVKPF